jgi:hypothetical protein
MPPKPRPDENELSPSSSPQDTSSLLATSEALRRIESLAGRRRESSKVNLPSQTSSPSEISSSPIPPRMASQISAPLQRVHSNPMPMQYGQGLLVEPAMPQTPTTRRRQMLATELPEDLRLSEWQDSRCPASWVILLMRTLPRRPDLGETFSHAVIPAEADRRVETMRVRTRFTSNGERRPDGRPARSPYATTGLAACRIQYQRIPQGPTRCK